MLDRPKRKVTRGLSACRVAFLVLIGWANPAPAFYWAGWPGAGTNPPPRIVPEVIRVEEPEPPTPEPPPPEEPRETPEPATMLLAGAGLAVVGGARWVRKRRNPRTGG